MSEIKQLSELLSEMDALPWYHALYLPHNIEWNLETHCAILDPDDCDSEEDIPQFARENGLDYVMSVQQLQDIRSNALAQRSDLTLEELFSVFIYYYENDSFYEWHQ